MKNMILLPTDALGLSRGASGAVVGELQLYLGRFGWLQVPGQSPVVAHHETLPAVEPNKFDDATEAALASFQRFYRLSVSGTLDNDTLALMQRPRCGVPDKPVLGPSNGQGMPANFVTGPNRWTDLHLGYNLTKGTADLSDTTVLRALHFAYRSWCLIANIEVHRVTSGPDIEVRFEAGNHGDGSTNAFDGVGSVLAHAYSPPPYGEFEGDLHFDDAETWTRDLPPSGTDLDTVALHEAGHTLGLDHSDDPSAVMFAFYAAGRRTLINDDIGGMRSLYGKRGRNIWTNLDAAVEGQGPFAGKAYFFRGDRYLRYDFADDLPDAGYSKTIAGNWPGLPAGFTSGIDAAINGQKQFAGKLYLFKGDRYVRYDWAKDKADPGYPKPIAGNWPGLPAAFTSGIGTAVTGNGPFAGKAYFFKGNQYVRYDWAADTTDPGYPKPIAGLWPGLPAGFTSNLQASLNGQVGFAGKLYFFKGADYVRYDWAADKTDSGYPKPIEFNWF